MTPRQLIQARRTGKLNAAGWFWLIYAAALVGSLAALSGALS